MVECSYRHHIHDNLCSWNCQRTKPIGCQSGLILQFRRLCSFRVTKPLDHIVRDGVREAVNYSKAYRTLIYLSRMTECLFSTLRLTVSAAIKTDAYLINCAKNPVYTKKPRQPTKRNSLRAVNLVCSAKTTTAVAIEDGGNKGRGIGVGDLSPALIDVFFLRDFFF